MVQATSSLQDYLAAAARQIDSALAGYTECSPTCPPRLAEAMRYSLLAPGKRLRPVLVLLAAEACGGQQAAAMPAACAVEMIHTYSLIHDDLPAMDDDDLRRGRPTCHKVYGEALAILAGDALLTLAFEVLAKHVQPPAVAAECCAALAEAAGPDWLVAGQVADLEGASGATDLAALEAIHIRKTGAMLAVSLRLGALTAGADTDQQQALDAYGRRLGLAFQIADDLLDVRGDQQRLGKRVGKDADRGKLTFPGLLGTEESARRAERLVAEACQALQPFGSRAPLLEALAYFVLQRDH